MKPYSRIWLLSLAALLVIIPVVILDSFQTAQAASDPSVAATYSRGTLRAAIPYNATRAGAGQLTVEVLDPEDDVVGRSQRAVNLSDGQGWWHEDLKLTKPVGTDDLVWHRLRYRFVYNNGKDGALEGTESISQILRTPVIHILGQQSYLTGGAAGGTRGGHGFEK